jgi:hypothetical protein
MPVMMLKFFIALFISIFKHLVNMAVIATVLAKSAEAGF